ncbi:hypothetical protein MBLNU230_g5313t1 [Neophaeotheca triangularis]
MSARTLPTTMRAAQWTSNTNGLDANLKLHSSLPLPASASSLPAGSTLVKVAYSSLNPVDYKLPELPIIGNYLLAPGIPAMDYAGTVVTSTLDHLKPGEPVFGKLEPPKFGACAEYAVVGREGCVPVPPGVSLRDAATVGVAGLTAWQCLLAAGAGQGKKVLVNGGSGGVGTFMVQFTKALGCYVVATCSGANAEFVKGTLGADEVVDYRTVNVVSHLKRQGVLFDAVIDNVLATTELYFNCHHFLKEGAQYVTIAGSPNLAAVKDLMMMMLLPGALGGGQRPFKFLTVQSSAEHYAAIADLIASGKVKPVIEKEYELKQAGEAYTRLKTGRTRGKIVINVGGV